MINEGIKKMIEENALALATTDKSGNPHNIAIGYVKVISKNQLVVSNNYLVESINNIKNTMRHSTLKGGVCCRRSCLGCSRNNHTINGVVFVKFLDIKINPNVSLVVWARNWEENCIGYELKGKAEYFTSGKWLDFIKKIPINQGEPCKGAILITLNKIKPLT